MRHRRDTAAPTSSSSRRGEVARRPLAALALFLALEGCAAPVVIGGGGGYCAPPAPVEGAVLPDPSTAGGSREENALALLGLRSLAPVERGEPGRALDVEARVRLVERIELARIAIAATVAELDCEGERAKQAADSLIRAQGGEVQALTVASIGAATATAIAGVLLSTGNASAPAQDGVAIAGGGITAGFGLATLRVHPSVPFEHARNLLADVWTGPTTSSTYPPIVWAYLTRDEFSNDQRRSIRAKIVERWRRFQLLTSDRALQALIFGGGGRYDADALRMRAGMLAEVKAEVSLANQDLSTVASRFLAPGP